MEGGEWGNHKKGTSTSLKRMKMVEQGYSLNGFTQTHLISKNDIPIVVPGIDEPVQGLELVIPQEFSILVHRLRRGQIELGLSTEIVEV